MKHLLTGLILILALISFSAIAQGNSEDAKIMSQLTTGAFSGPYQTSNQNEAWFMLYDGENYYRIVNEKLKKDVNPNWIKSVEVLKNVKATQKFGEEAKNGVVIIILKNDVEDVKLCLEKVKKSYYNK